MGSKVVALCLDEIRQGGERTGGPAAMTPKDRSRFLSKLDEVINAFEEAGAAAAPIYDIAQVCADPQYQALGSIATVEDATLGPIRMQNLMFRMSDTPGKVRHPGPRLGENTDAVLREVLGLSDARLKELHATGVIEPSPGKPSTKRAAA